MYRAAATSLRMQTSTTTQITSSVTAVKRGGRKVLTSPAPDQCIAVPHRVRGARNPEAIGHATIYAHAQRTKIIGRSVTNCLIMRSCGISCAIESEGVRADPSFQQEAGESPGPMVTRTGSSVFSLSAVLSSPSLHRTVKVKFTPPIAAGMVTAYLLARSSRWSPGRVRAG